MSTGGEPSQFAVEHHEIKLTIQIAVDEDIKFGRIVRMRPFAIGVDRELNSKITPADVHQTRAHRFQVDDSKGLLFRTLPGRDSQGRIAKANDDPDFTADRLQPGID